MDDPVTSLDGTWKKLIAEELTKQAINTQVIVFTHDLPFVYFLHEYCDELSVSRRHHWVQQIGGVPGVVSQNSSPALERDYKKLTRVQELLAAADRERGASQELLLREGFRALRSCYEALVVFEVLEEVVQRFDERISVGRLKDIVVDREFAFELEKAYGAVSRFIHLGSDNVGAGPPTADDLRGAINRFQAIRGKYKELKKARRNSS